MADCKQAKAPVAANQQLPTLTEAEVDITDYQRCIGSLMYPMICMRPDIAFQLVYSHVMSLVAFFAIFVEPAITSLKSKAITPSSLKAFVDSDWAGDRVDRKFYRHFCHRIDCIPL